MIGARLTASKTVPRRWEFPHSLLAAAGTNCENSLITRKVHRLFPQTDKDMSE